MANTERTSRLRCVTGSATKAEYNPGKIIIAPDSARSIIVVGGWLRSTGTVTEATSIDICDTTGTPVVGVSIAAAQLANGVIAPFTAATATLTTFGVANTKGKGIQILSVGTDESTATVCDYCVEYMTV
jgi:hypothetical protein